MAGIASSLHLPFPTHSRVSNCATTWGAPREGHPVTFSEFPFSGFPVLSPFPKLPHPCGLPSASCPRCGVRAQQNVLSGPHVLICPLLLIQLASCLPQPVGHPTRLLQKRVALSKVAPTRGSKPETSLTSREQNLAKPGLEALWRQRCQTNLWLQPSSLFVPCKSLCHPGPQLLYPVERKITLT